MLYGNCSQLCAGGHLYYIFILWVFLLVSRTKIILRCVDLWIMKCVKTALLLLHCRASFPSQSAPLSCVNLKTLRHSIVTTANNWSTCYVPEVIFHSCDIFHLPLSSVTFVVAGWDSSKSVNDHHASPLEALLTLTMFASHWNNEQNNIWKPQRRHRRFRYILNSTSWCC